MLAARLALVALGLATAVPLRLHKAILPGDGPSSNSSLNSTMNCTWNSTSIDYDAPFYDRLVELCNLYACLS